MEIAPFILFGIIFEMILIQNYLLDNSDNKHILPLIVSFLSFFTIIFFSINNLPMWFGGTLMKLMIPLMIPNLCFIYFNLTGVLHVSKLNKKFEDYKHNFGKMEHKPLTLKH